MLPALFRDPRAAALLAALPFLLTAHPARAEVKIYPDVPGEPVSKLFRVQVDNHPVAVYLTRVMAIAATNPKEQRITGEASFCAFDLDVTVNFPEPIEQAKILPSSSGIVPTFSGKTVTFTITKPGPVTLEINGDWLNSLQIFANPPERNAPDPKDPNVIYFGPGIHTIQPLLVGSGKTVYLAGGAIVYGQLTPRITAGPVLALDGSNITLRGRGILDGSLIPRPSPSGNILTVHGSNIHLEGVTLRDSSSWNCVIRQSDHVDVENVKIFGWRGSSDGIDICNSRNVSVTDSFVRTWDDLIVVKTNLKGSGDSRDIDICHDVLWNEKAHALSLGAELRENAENITFADCDIIHDKGHQWLLRIFNSDSGTIKNVVFENIRIEEARRVFSLWIGKANWSRDADRGHIDGVVFRDIRVPLPEPPVVKAAQLKGFDEQHLVQNVQFENVTIAGKPMKPDDIESDAFCQNVSVKP